MANIWKFEHLGFIASRSRATTDAMNALSQWIFLDPRRRFRVVSGDDGQDVLVAELATDSDDCLAETDLDQACAKYGVRRVQVLRNGLTVH